MTLSPDEIDRILTELTELEGEIGQLDPVADAERGSVLDIKMDALIDVLEDSGLYVLWENDRYICIALERGNDVDSD